MSKRFFWIFLPLLLLDGMASAQIIYPARTDKWEFSGFFGINKPTGDDSFLTPVSDGSTQLVSLDSETGYVVGARITQNLRNFFAAELEYSFANQRAALVNLSPALPRFDLRQKVHTVNYNGLVYLTRRGSKIRPFGTAGVGVSLFQLSGETGSRGVAVGLDLVDRWKFAFSWGGGVKILKWRNWGVRFDFRDTVTGIPDFGLPRVSEVVNGIPGPALRPDGLMHRLQFSGGFVYSFSGR